jgi:hypothetical protein
MKGNQGVIPEKHIGSRAVASLLERAVQRRWWTSVAESALPMERGGEEQSLV